MLERAKQMEELQLIINQLEEKNKYLEKNNDVLKAQLNEESFKNAMMDTSGTKGESWLIKKIRDMSNDIYALKENNEKMFEYLHMKCETLERDNHKLLEFSEHIKELTDNHYDDIYKTKGECISAINELLETYDFK